MTPLRILEFIRRSIDPVGALAIAEYFGISHKCALKYLHTMKELGDVKSLKIHHTICYFPAHDIEGIKAEPRTYDFKPLKSVPSAMGTRIGSNDHLQHKSKHS